MIHKGDIIPYTKFLRFVGKAEYDNREGMKHAASRKMAEVIPSGVAVFGSIHSPHPRTLGGVAFHLKRCVGSTCLDDGHDVEGGSHGREERIADL